MKDTKKEAQTNKGKKSHGKEESIGRINKRIRDMKRTLQKGAKTAQIKVETERRLRALEYELGERHISNDEEALYQKYRTIKFIELKKAQRKIKQATKALENATNEEERKERQKALEERRIDEMYIMHYPKVLPYISLYEKDKSDTTKNEERRQELRQKIKDLLDNNGDMADLSKEYRQAHREKLVRLKRIPAVRPVTDEQQETPVEKSTASTDDFFE
ncbi:hypothetical protein BJV82DRAFT_592385 [Fennellomyces sp. T-0311]|nr:hypothetical protein BJV82DRAFT_592385 [Fennellomyces sp. T-0311]